jgi:hypothetical protein
VRRARDSTDVADRAAGVNLEQPTHADVGRTWDVMRRFAREPADDVPSQPGDYDDGILAQYGVYDWSGTILPYTPMFSHA